MGKNINSILHINDTDPIIPQLLKFKPGKRATFTAIAHLTEARHIGKFFQEQVLLISACISPIENPVVVLCGNIIWTCERYDEQEGKKRLKNWQSILEKEFALFFESLKAI